MWNYLSRMAELNGKGFVKMKETLHPKYWCRAFFDDGTKCDNVDNNNCETFNARIIEARSLPIISMLEEIRIYVMNKMVEKRDAAKNLKQPYAPRIAKELAINKKKTHSWKLQYNGVDGYEVSLNDYKFVEYLGKQECTCRRWQLKGYPCVHGIACISHEKGKLKDYISHWYKLPTYLKAYTYMMQQVRGIGDWPMSTEPTLLPPIDRRMPGRPKLNKRRLEEAERTMQQEGLTHVTRLGRRMVCTICKKPDHNKRTCPDKDKENQNNGQSEPLCEMEAGPSQPPLTQEQQPPPAQEQPIRRQQTPRPPTGFGVYINPETGEQAINPGTMPTRGRGRGRVRETATHGND